MLYYLTGLATERSAVLAYNKLHAGLVELGERAVAATVVAPIRRQEPGHFAYYQMAARELWAQLACLAAVAGSHVAAADVRAGRGQQDGSGRSSVRLMRALGISTGDEADLRHYARQVGRVEHELLWANRQGLRVPDYVFKALPRAPPEAAADLKGGSRSASRTE